MKLVNHFTIRFSLLLVVVFAIWAALFYMVVMIEVNDEIDDSLEDYAEYIISESLAGNTQPQQPMASNSQHYIRAVSKRYADQTPHITYADSTVYMPGKNETEPARVYTAIFKDQDEQYYELKVFAPTIEPYDLKEAIAMWILVLYALMLTVLIGIASWTFKRDLRPLYRLLGWLDKYKIGSENEPLNNDTTIQELSQLNHSVQGYVSRGEQLFEQQKLFIGNASHEMQTPIAVCQNRIELLMDDEQLSDSQCQELSKVLVTLNYMSKLNKSLLLLTRIENGQFAEARPIDLSAVVDRFVNDYNEVYQHQQLNVEVRRRARWFPVMNDTLAKMLVANLLKNAYTHNTDRGKVVICMTDDSLKVSNTAKNGPLDASHIFDRFYQGGDKHEGSTGLGLSICDTICRSCGLVITYSYDGMHTFTVTSQR